MAPLALQIASLTNDKPWLTRHNALDKKRVHPNKDFLSISLLKYDKNIYYRHAEYHRKIAINFFVSWPMCAKFGINLMPCQIEPQQMTIFI